MNLPDGWRPIANRRAADGSAIYLAERMDAVDLGARKRNMFQRFGILRETAEGPTLVQAVWEDRAGAYALFEQASA